MRAIPVGMSMTEAMRDLLWDVAHSLGVSFSSIVRDAITERLIETVGVQLPSGERFRLDGRPWTEDRPSVVLQMSEQEYLGAIETVQEAMR